MANVQHSSNSNPFQHVNAFRNRYLTNDAALSSAGSTRSGDLYSRSVNHLPTDYALCNRDVEPEASLEEQHPFIRLFEVLFKKPDELLKNLRLLKEAFTLDGQTNPLTALITTVTGNPDNWFEEALSDECDRPFAEINPYLPKIFGVGHKYANASWSDWWDTVDSIKHSLFQAVFLTEPEIFKNAPEWLKDELNEMFTMEPAKVLGPFEPAPHETILAKYPEGFDLSKFDNEQWFYVNGINVDERTGEKNGQMLADAFGRKIEVLHNPTDGALFDIAETVLGRQVNDSIEQTDIIFENLKNALQNDQKDKVVVMAHSGGTVQMTNVFERLAKDEDLTPEQLSKLEIYNFANCSNGYELDSIPEGVHIENFANENDMVARLGNLSTEPEHDGIVMTGPTYVNEGKWGHMFNMFYLEELNDYDPATQENIHYVPKKLVDKEWVDDTTIPSSKLYSYLFGRTPEATA